jgi:hypothetical protein
MPANQILNPMGAFQTVTSFLTYVDANGQEIQYERVTAQYRANDTIAAKNAVGFVAATAGVPLSVELLDVSDATAAASFAGVATESAVAGDVITIVVQGPAIVTINNGTPAFLDFAIKHATVDGCLIASPAPDATTVAGTLLGVWLSAEIGTTDTAVVNVGRYS